MKNNTEAKTRFPLSGKHPKEYPISSNEDVICVDVADALGESDMRFILARRHQFGGIREIQDAFAIVKNEIRKGNCRNPGALFNSLLTQELRKRQKNPQA